MDYKVVCQMAQKKLEDNLGTARSAVAYLELRYQAVLHEVAHAGQLRLQARKAIAPADLAPA